MLGAGNPAAMVEWPRDKATGGAGALFIHGTASSGRIWSGLLSIGSLRAFSGPILTPDIPGMGDAQAAQGSAMSFDGWLEFFRDVAGGQPTHLVGHSLGGAIAICLAREHWAASVALISPATRRYCEERQKVSRAGANPGSIVLPEPLGRLVSDARAVSRADAKILREDYAKAAPLMSSGVPWPVFSTDEAAYLRGKRVLLIYGEDDAIVPACYFRQLGEALRVSGEVDFRVRALPGCGHIPQIERPAEVAASLEEFWTSTS